MNKKDLLDNLFFNNFITDDGRFNPNSKKMFEQNRSLLNDVIFLTSFLPDNVDLKERFYCLVEDIIEKPLCKKCLKEVTYNIDKKKYNEYCSLYCSRKTYKIVKDKEEKNAVTPIITDEIYRIYCRICNEKFKTITLLHLKKHGLSLSDYKQKYPLAPTRCEMSTILKKETSKKTNEARKGVPRSEETKEKIRKIKKENKNTAWNKGIPMTQEQKEKLSNIRKEQFQTGGIKHWNSGKTTNKDTKEKIKNTLVSKNLTMSDESINKRNNTIAEKVKKGWLSPLKGRVITDTERLKKLKDQLHQHNKKKKESALIRINVFCIEHNIKIIKTCDRQYYFTLQCEKCNAIYERTKQVFIHSKKDDESYLCPICYPRATLVSNKEIELQNFITDIVKNTAITEIELNNRIILGGKEIDIYLPQVKIGFEFTGIYWHSELCVEEKNHLLWKQQYAFTKGIRLITIFEDEWDYKKNIVMSRIKHILKIQNRKLFARNCIIKEISNEEKSIFLKENHIQGNDVSAIRYGSFFNDELLAVMTFTKTNFVKGGDGSVFELNRFCLKNNTNIVGIASKMFSHFIKQHSPDTVISFSDRRWSDGNLYKQLNFVFADNTPPSYWYIKKGGENIRLHRSNFMKHMLNKKLEFFDNNISEHENMKNNGYYRIWDCGNMKWIWRK